MKCRVRPTTSRRRASSSMLPGEELGSDASRLAFTQPAVFSGCKCPPPSAHRAAPPSPSHRFDLFVSCADAPAARADLDGWYPQLVVDVGVGPDAGAVRRFRLDLFAEQVLVDFFCRLDQRLDIFSLVTEERFVYVHLVIKAEFVEGLLQFILDRDRADVRRYAHVDVDGTNAGEVVRPVGRTALDRADISLGKQWASGRIVDVFLFELRSPSLQRVDDLIPILRLSDRLLPSRVARWT